MPEEMAAQKVDWFHAYLESGDATESARKCGLGGKYASWKGNSLVKQFYPLIVEAVQVRRAATEPLALKVHEDILRLDHMVPVILKDADGNQFISDRKVPDAKILAVKQKAADSILDRGVMPKGLALHGDVVGARGEQDARNWQDLLDDQVREWGAERVKEKHAGRADFREYLERKYPLKQINAAPAAAEAREG